MVKCKCFDCHKQFIDLSNRDDVDDDFIKQLNCPITLKLDLSNTKVTYEGIRHLWKSENIGKERHDDPIYEAYYNLPISCVYVEIDNTPALQQYYYFKKDNKVIFPLPLKENFLIEYDNSDVGQIGFKEIILTVNGVKIE